MMETRSKIDRGFKAKKNVVETKNDYATENILRNNFDRAYKESSGLRCEVIAKYRKY